jgi:type IV pilus assembly protein PilM
MGDETSIWKKEISFRRKPKPKANAESAPPAPTPVESPAPAQAEHTSVWKKEISFRRKSKAAAPAPAPAPVVAEDNPQPTSVWKKEISFRRKPKSDWVALPPDPSVSPAAPDPEVGWTPPAAVGEPVVPAVPPDVTAVVLPPMTPSPATLPAPAESASIHPATTDPSTFAPVPSEEGSGVTAVPPVSPAAAPPVSEVHVEADPAPAPEPSAPVPVNVPAPLPQPEPQPELTPAAAAVAEVAAAPAPVETGPEPALDLPEATPEAEPKRSRRLRRRERSEAKSASARSQVVGLKIGASQIAAAQVVNRGGPRIVRMARMPLQRGVVVGGELREPEELATVLKAFFKKNKLPRTNVRLGISNNRIGVRTFEITGIEDSQQLANAVRFRAQETLPIPLDEAVLDHRILDDKVGEDGVRVCRVLLVVAHRELVERYVGACRKAGLKLVGIDLEAFALLRALSDPDQPPGEDAAVVCVSIGHDRSTLAVSDGRVCEFTRVLAWGGSALDGALARVLDLTPSAVVPIKHALSLRGEGEAAGLDARHADEARRAMASELQSFARELVASLRFYQEQPNSLGIVEILVTGGGATCAGLTDELERLIGIPVRLADPLVRMKTRKVLPESPATGASMAVAVGLGIED